jgi:hypothetical protein
MRRAVRERRSGASLDRLLGTPSTNQGSGSTKVSVLPPGDGQMAARDSVGGEVSEPSQGNPRIAKVDDTRGCG